MKEAERVERHLFEIRSKLRAALDRADCIAQRHEFRPDISRIDAVFLNSFLREATVLNDKLLAHFGRKEKVGRKRIR